MNNLTGKDNQFFKLAFWGLGLGAAWMWLPIKDTLLNLLSVVLGLVFVFAIADSVLIMLGAISDPAQGIQARVANWVESMRTTPAPPAPSPVVAAPTPVVAAPVAPVVASPVQATRPRPEAEVRVRRNTSP